MAAVPMSPQKNCRPDEDEASQEERQEPPLGNGTERVRAKEHQGRVGRAEDCQEQLLPFRRQRLKDMQGVSKGKGGKGKGKG